VSLNVDLYRVDSFTDRPFGGNPAGVCLLPEPCAEEWMQSVAREMNLSATAFLHPAPPETPEDPGGWRLRWFTSRVELELCGHATLASAHVLWETGLLPPGEPARFHTRSGLLTAERRDGAIEMDFPARTAAEVEPPEGLAEALGVAPRFVGRSLYDVLVEAASEEEVRTAVPDLARLRTLPVRGVILTAAASSPAAHPYDFVSRFFAPGVGIDEDAVTGSAHCTLGPYWAARLGRTSFLAWQASPRGGAVRVRVDGERVKLGGQAVTVLRGELLG
jgi:PhzF family phenazine biosynthesis protein